MKYIHTMESTTMPVRFLQFLMVASILLTAGNAFAQKPAEKQKKAEDAAALPAAELNNRKNEFKNRELIRLQGSEKEIDSLVAEAVKCYQNNEFDKAIDLYLNAKKQLETLYKTSNLPRIKTKIDNCDLSISKAYYYWAQKIYFDAVKSANASDYEVAIEKCKKAIEVYPPCKEKMEKIIEKYELLREKTLTLDKIKANTKEDPAEVREKRVLLRQGEVLYKEELWDKARAKFEEVIAMDPYNEVAIDYIRKINIKLLDAAKRRTGVTRNLRNTETVWNPITPVVPLSNTGNTEIQETGVVKEAFESPITKKLKEIIIDRIDFEDVSIATAAKYLKERSKEKDPEKIGVNIVLRGKINQPIAAEGEEPLEEEVTTEGEGTTVQPLTMMVDNIPLEAAIKYICNQANLKYRIEKYAVVIASPDVKLEDVETKIYPIEKDFINLGTDENIKSSFESRGISFPAGAAIVYDESIGRLIVTNTPENLQKIEDIIKEMNIVDPQVLIQTKFVEVKLNDLEELGFKYNFSRQNSNVSKLTQSDLIAWGPGETQVLEDKNYSIYKTNTKTETIDLGALGGGSSSDSTEGGSSLVFNKTTTSKWLDYGGTVRGDGATYINNAGQTVYYAKAPIQDKSISFGPNDDMIRVFNSTGQLDSPSIVNGYGELFNMSYYNKYGYKLDASIYALDQSDATDVLSCPRVTTMNGQPATIKMVTEKYYPTDWEEAEYTTMSGGSATIPVFIGSTAELDEATEEGIIFTVTPNVSADKYTINLFMQPLVQKFIGWDDYSYEVPVDITINGNNQVVNVPNTMKMPIFERRTTKTNIECTDNGTIVMGGMIQDETTVLDDSYPILGDIPLIGRLFQSKGRAGAKKNLMIFLSCRLVNPDGSPLREREDRGIPPFKN